MKYLRNYESYKSINEEFIGRLIKGSLSKLFQVFMNPFKDLVNDIKNGFKEGDPNSIKGIIMTNFNQAIDGAQKLIRDPKLKDADILGIMDQFITSLSDLASGIGKDFDSAIGSKSKASGAKEIAKSILLGNKEAGWKGIIGGQGDGPGLLVDPNYKYSKPKYETALTAASAKKTGPEALKAKQNAAISFFDNFQKDLTSQLDRDLNEEEMKKIYDEAVKNGGGTPTSALTYDQLKQLYDQKKAVMYKMNGYDDKIKPDDQKGKVGIKLIDTLDDQGNVGFKDAEGNRFTKKFADIIGAAPIKGEEAADDLKQELTKIKDDAGKMSAIKNYTQFISTGQKDKIAQVNALINPVKEETPKGNE